MEDLRILNIVRAVHETKMDWYWKRMRKEGEVNGLIWLLESRILDDKEILSIEHSLQLLSEDVRTEIAKTDYIANDGVAKEMAISEAVRDREQELVDTWRSDCARSVVVCSIAFLFSFGLFYSAFFVQQIASATIPLVVLGVIFLIMGIVGLEHTIQRKAPTKNAHIMAVNVVNSEIAEKLKKRENDIELLKKIHQCLEVIDSSP